MENSISSIRRTIVVTGASGFIGMNLVQRLTELDYRVIAIARQGENFLACPIVPSLEYVNLDGVDTLIHLAAETDTTLPDPAIYHQVNFQWAKETFLQAKTNGVKRIIYASSCAVYGNGPCPFREDQELEPVNAYGESKALLDRWCIMQTGIPMIGLRFSNVYGLGEHHKGKAASMVTQIMDQVTARVRPKLFTPGNQRRDWVYVKDAVAAILSAMFFDTSEIFNIGSGVSVSFNSVLTTVRNVLFADVQAEYIDNPHSGYQSVTEVDISKARDLLHWSPRYQLEEGLRDYAKDSSLPM